MPRQGLTRQVLIQAALHLIEERGYASFSMGELAKYLHVRPASLYNHIENLDTLYTEVGLAAISQMVSILDGVSPPMEANLPVLVSNTRS